jgi:putative transposase
MLNPEALEAWCNQVGVPAHGRALIDRIRASNPARRVGGGRSSVSGRYPSRKMGVTIQFESHRVELAGIYEMEYDPDVLEFLDQPIQIKLNYESAGGKHLGVLHTPDFFVIRRTAAGWEEWKTEEELLHLAERSPNRYRAAEGGRWRCPPGEAYAGDFGFYYQVRSSREINWVYQQNVEFLEDYLRSDLSIPPAAQEQIQATVSSSGIRLSDLLREIADDVTRDDIFAMVALGRLDVDLAAARLTQAEQVYVRLNRWEGAPCNPESNVPSHRAVLIEGADGLLNPASPVTGLLPQMGPKEVAEANRRLKLIRAYQAREALEENVPARTIRHWLQRYRQAEALQGNGYLGLLPRFHNCGNRDGKLPEKTTALISEIIGTEYEALKQKSRFHVYGALIRACESAGTLVPSYKTFCLAVIVRACLQAARPASRISDGFAPPGTAPHHTSPW